jgi:hypothetical protein
MYLTSVSWTDAFWSDWVWVDVVIFLILGAVHTGAWISTSPQDPGDATTRAAAAAALTSAGTAGLTAVGIMLPLSLAAGQLHRTGPGPLEHVFFADIWFALSLLFGLLALYVIAPNAVSQYVVRRRIVGIPFGLQLLSLLIGVARLLVGIGLVLGTPTSP